MVNLRKNRPGVNRHREGTSSRKDHGHAAQPTRKAADDTDGLENPGDDIEVSEDPRQKLRRKSTLRSAKQSVDAADSDLSDDPANDIEILTPSRKPRRRSTLRPTKKAVDAAADIEVSADMPRQKIGRTSPPEITIGPVVKAEKITAEPDDNARVFVPFVIFRKFGFTQMAVLMAQVRYWNLLKGKLKRLAYGPGGEDDAWGTSYAGIERQTGIQQPTAKWLVSKLEESGWIETWHTGTGTERSRIRLTAKGQRWMERKGLMPDNSKPGGVSIPAAMIRSMESLHAAILLAKVYPWFLPNKAGETKLTIFDEEGRGWRANGRCQLMRETGFNRFQLARALNWLEDDHWIKTSNDPLGKGIALLHIHLDPVRVQRKLDLHCPQKTTGRHPKAK